MKASRLLQLYQEGRRDFRGENLGGQNFKGADLSVFWGVYIGWRELNGNDRNVWVRSVATTFTPIGVTSFRGAILTDATLTQVQIDQIDLTEAVLTGTHRED